MKKNLLLYFLIVGVFTFLIWYIIDQGKDMKPKADSLVNTTLQNNQSQILGYSQRTMSPEKISQLVTRYQHFSGLDIKTTFRNDSVFFKSASPENKNVNGENKSSSLDLTS